MPRIFHLEESDLLPEQIKLFREDVIFVYASGVRSIHGNRVLDILGPFQSGLIAPIGTLMQQGGKLVFIIIAKKIGATKLDFVFGGLLEKGIVRNVELIVTES